MCLHSHIHKCARKYITYTHSQTSVKSPVWLIIGAMKKAGLFCSLMQVFLLSTVLTSYNPRKHEQVKKNNKAHFIIFIVI